MNNMFIKDCPICQCKQTQRVYVTKDFFLSQEEFEIWECTSCRVRFTVPVPSEEEIKNYYKKDEYYSHITTHKSFIFYIYDFIRKVNLRKKNKFIQENLHINKGRLLDVGCGSGDFLLYMSNCGWNCTGVEPDEQSRNYLNAMNKFTVFSSLDEVKIETGFDLITFWHVIEHFHQPTEAIQKAYHLLNDDGVLLIAVPNYDSPDAEYFMSYWAAWDVPRHLFHFNKQSLSYLLNHNLFHISRFSGLYFDVFYISYLSQKYLKKFMPLITGAIVGLRLWIKAKLQNNPSSLVVIAKK